MKHQKYADIINPRSYTQCCVIHSDKEGNELPQCIYCINCKEFIRPEDFDKECIPRVD
jgi:hypothetical protein